MVLFYYIRYYALYIFALLDICDKNGIFAQFYRNVIFEVFVNNIVYAKIMNTEVSI